eukprot:1261271-Rhodomonas_salina.2
MTNLLIAIVSSEYDKAAQAGPTLLPTPPTTLRISYAQPGTEERYFATRRAEVGVRGRGRDGT